MKEKALLTYLFATMLLITASCRHESSTTSQLQMLDTLVEVAPDSVFRILSQQNTSTYSQAELMHAELLRAKAMNKADILFTTDSTLIQVSAYYDKHGTPNQQMLAHYLLGRAYSDMGSAPRAIESFHEAAERADTTALDCDYRTLSSIYSQMAYEYGKLILSQNEKECREKAYRYALLAKNPRIAGYEYCLLSRPYMFQGKRDSAITILLGAKQLLNRVGETQEWLESSIPLICLYILNNNVDAADTLIREFDRGFDYFNENGDLPDIFKYYFATKGDFFLLKNNLDSANIYYRKSLHENMEYTEKTQTFHGLLKLYEKLQQPDSIAKYSELYCLCNDSTYNYNDRNITAKMGAAFNYSIVEKHALQQNLKNLRTRNRLLGSIFILCFVVSIIVYVWQMQKKKAKEKLKEMEQRQTEYENSIKEYRHKTSQLQKLDEVHKEVIQLIQSELIQANSHAEFLNNQLTSLTKEYKEDIEKLQEQINTMSQTDATYNNVETSSQFASTDIVKDIQNRVQHPSSKMQDSDWNLLQEAINQYFPYFFNNIEASPSLTKRMRRICYLSLLNLRTKDIASIMDMSVQSISNMKQEICLILFNENSAKGLTHNLKQKYHIIT